MSAIFVDTLYLVALVNPQDQWHSQAKEIEREIAAMRLVTTEAVLTEYLNYFSAFNSEMRRAVADVVREILIDPAIETVTITREIFVAALELYEERPDKGYSLTDCASMHLMRARRITEVLTHDKHFAQEGFVKLL